MNKDMGGVETPVEGAVPDAKASDAKLPDDDTGNATGTGTGTGAGNAVAEDEPDIDPSTLGPGPRPLIDVAREHGGDAGTSSSGNNSDSSNLKSPDGSGGHVEGGSGGGEGTGELYVKSSGLAADGGDFDVTQPGAGREADRK